MNLSESFRQLQTALEPLGVEIGPEVLDVWRDRVKAGREPIPEAAVRDLAAWAAKQLADRT